MPFMHRGVAYLLLLKNRSTVVRVSHVLIIQYLYAEDYKGHVYEPYNNINKKRVRNETFLFLFQGYKREVVL